MWFHDLGQIKDIATKNGTSVFVVPQTSKIDLPEAIVLQPEERTVITIEQVRKIGVQLGLKQINDRYVIIRPADKLSLDAANAFLKNLEEPGDRVHYILITDTPSKLLPTILSRATVYYLKGEGFTTEIVAPDKKKELAKQLITARPDDIVKIAEVIAKKKPARESALEIVGLAIEMLYKSYFITGKDVFIRKLPEFLKMYENIGKNGHIKLQIVANLV